MVQAEIVHQVGEEPGVDVFGASGAELVVLDRHHRRLRTAVQPRDDPGVRIGFLQVVEGTERRVFPDLPQQTLALQEVAHTGAVVHGRFGEDRGEGLTGVGFPGTSVRKAVRKRRSSAPRSRNRSGSHSRSSPTPWNPW